MTMNGPAVVMNMFYTGLGIARSLGERGIPVFGLSSEHRIYGNFTRYAKTVFCPDGRNAPDELADFLIRFAKQLGRKCVIYPTRDDDVVFLDRFRERLAPYYSAVIPERAVLGACLDKWETYLWAKRAGVATPKCWLIEDEAQLLRMLEEPRYPCVLKPVSAYTWRQQGNWDLVGGRKAIPVSSAQELLNEYRDISRASRRALVQEMIPGDDRRLTIAACYFDRQSRLVAAFNTQKLLQIPDGFGTGCIVQAVDRPEVVEPTARLLEKMGYSGIAEVEYKWNAQDEEYQLIEINPRPWDQHRLGKTCGTDLAWLAYCDHAGIGIPAIVRQKPGARWIAEDAFLTEALRRFWKRDGRLGQLLRLARGKRIYAIWSVRDPAPFIAYMASRFLPALLGQAIRTLRRTAPSSAQQSRAERLSAQQDLERGHTGV